jgi:hypothetical protein
MHPGEFRNVVSALYIPDYQPFGYAHGTAFGYAQGTASLIISSLSRDKQQSTTYLCFNKPASIV